MSGVVRLGDQSSGHDGFPPQPSTSASSDVFADSLGVVRLGDQWAPHTDGVTIHDGVQAEGSSDVFVNGLPIARIGDAISCGSFCAEGSSDVFAN